MKNFLLTCATFAALAAPAAAADLPVKAQPVAVYDWTGCYLGANVGWKWARFRESVDTAGGSVLLPGIGLVPFAPGHSDFDPLYTSSAAAGGQVGCRWENRDHWVFGFEGDFDWTNLHGTTTNNVATTGIFPGDTVNNRASWESSARLIIGRSFDHWLVYATGGFAFTRVTMNANFIATTVAGVPIPAASGSDSTFLTGGTVGMGAAYALTRNWELGAEYRYTFYQMERFNLGNVTAFCLLPGPTCALTPATGHKALETNEILVKLNYRFDWGR